MGAAAGCCLSINEEMMRIYENIPDAYAAGYEQGYAAGFRLGYETGTGRPMSEVKSITKGLNLPVLRGPRDQPRRRRKLSAWNKFVKANSKKPRFKYRNGKLNLKKMAVAFRKTPAGKKKRR